MSLGTAIKEYHVIIKPMSNEDAERMEYCIGELSDLILQELGIDCEVAQE